VTPCLPAEYITDSAGIRLPLARLVTVPRSETWTLSTSSPKRNVTAWSRRWNFSDSTTSGSQNSTIRSRFSTTVTRVPRAANIDAYSIPITPAPTTTIEPGTRSSCSTPSESSTYRSSNSTAAGRTGLVPVAITIFSAVTVLLSPRRAPVTRIVCASRKLPVPCSRSTWLRNSCERTTSTSRTTTCWVRAIRSAIVMSDFTR
jgi:hypothetical protein